MGKAFALGDLDLQRTRMEFMRTLVFSITVWTIMLSAEALKLQLNVHGCFKDCEKCHPDHPYKSVTNTGWTYCRSCKNSNQYLTWNGQSSDKIKHGFCSPHSTKWPSPASLFTTPQASKQFFAAGAEHFLTKAQNSYARARVFTNDLPEEVCIHDPTNTKQRYTSMLVGVQSVKNIYCHGADSARQCEVGKYGKTHRVCYPMEGTCALSSAGCPSPGTEEKDQNDGKEGGNKGKKVCCFKVADVPIKHRWMWVGATNSSQAEAKLATYVLPAF